MAFAGDRRRFLTMSTPNVLGHIIRSDDVNVDRLADRSAKRKSRLQPSGSADHVRKVPFWPHFPAMVITLHRRAEIATTSGRLWPRSAPETTTSEKLC